MSGKKIKLILLLIATIIVWIIPDALPIIDEILLTVLTFLEWRDRR